MRVSLLFFLLAGVCLAQKFTGFDPGSLDRKTDPCGNFYRYACGGWMAANPVPGDQCYLVLLDEPLPCDIGLRAEIRAMTVE